MTDAMLDSVWDSVWNIVKIGGIALIVFLIFREVVTWYWKINDISDLLKEIRDNTKKETKEGEKEDTKI